MSTYRIFGEYIRAVRIKAELGLREAAKLLGISPSYLSRLEAGDFPPPSPDVLRKMAALYQTNWFALLERAKERAPEAMASDAGAAPLLQAFYRLAKDQTPEMQEKMFEGALGAIQLPDDQKKALLDQLRQMLARANSRDLPRRASGNDGLYAMDIKPRYLSRVRVKELALALLAKVFGNEVPLPVPLDRVISEYDKEIVLTGRADIEPARLRDGSPAVLGLSRWSRDGKRRELIVHQDLLDAEDKPGRRRANFTIAHELFHCIEHLPMVQARNPDVLMKRSLAFVSLAPAMLRKPWYQQDRQKRALSTNEDWREWQANQFAAELLMPEEAVREAVMQFFGEESFTVPTGDPRKFADEIARIPCEDEFGNVMCLTDRFDVNTQPIAIRLLSLGIVKGAGVS
ncbi:MAG: XRE family transcriptional regulator [Phycisphaerales bacterium]